MPQEFETCPRWGASQFAVLQFPFSASSTWRFEGAEPVLKTAIFRCALPNSIPCSVARKCQYIKRLAVFRGQYTVPPNAVRK
jgi:hypothetical protein